MLAQTKFKPLVPRLNLMKKEAWCELSKDERLQHYFLLSFVIDGDVVNLNRLFQQDTPMFLENLKTVKRTDKKVSEQLEKEADEYSRSKHRSSFPQRYQMSSAIKEAIIPEVYRAAKHQKWSQEKKYEIIACLLRNGAKFEAALQYAIAAEVCRLVSDGLIDANISKYGVSLLHVVAPTGMASINFILDRGASPNHNCNNELIGYGTMLHVRIANEDHNFNRAYKKYLRP